MRGETGDARLGRLDDHARRVLAGLAPLVVERARTRADIDACLRMRYGTALEMGWIRPEDHPGGLERDAHDDRATHLVCRDGERVVGCLRIVPPSPGEPLPFEREFGLRLDRPGAAAEIGRLCVAQERRGAGGLPILAGLFAASWLEAREAGFTTAVAAVSVPLVPLYRAMGIGIRELGPPRRHWGEERVPVIVEGADLVVTAEEPELREDGWPGGLTRRGLLAGTAAAAAGGLMVLGVPSAAAGQGGPRLVGTGATDRTAIALMLRIDQEGRNLTGAGHLTRVDGLPLTAIYTRPPGTISTDPAASDVSRARFALAVRGRIQAISVLGSAITAIGTGTAAIHLLPAGGARLEDPASFAAGRVVAAFGVSFQNDLSIEAPDVGAASLHADLTQTTARAFTLGGRRMRIGEARLPWVLRAAGRGLRSDAALPRSQFFVSGGMGVVDAEPVTAGGR